MFKTLKKISINTTISLGLVFYAIGLLTHILVLTGILPYTWINGGRSPSFAAQVPVSISNIIVLVIAIIFLLIAGRNIHGKFNRVITILFWVLTAYWTIGFLMQLLGTIFEKLFMAPVLLLGVVSHLRLALEKK